MVLKGLEPGKCGSSSYDLMTKARFVVLEVVVFVYAIVGIL